MTLRNLGQALCALGDPGAALHRSGRRPLLRSRRSRIWRWPCRRESRRGGRCRGGGRRRRWPRRRAAPLATGPLPAGAAPGRRAERRRRLCAGPARPIRPRFEAELFGGWPMPPRRCWRSADRDRHRAAPGAAGARPRLGTGLSARAAPFARRLEELDLSPACSPRPAARALRRAPRGRPAGLAPGRPGAFGLIAAADVLNYLGDLGPALTASPRALRAPDGVAAFSVEAGGGGAFALGEAMRPPRPGICAALAAAAGCARWRSAPPPSERRNQSRWPARCSC